MLAAASTSTPRSGAASTMRTRRQRLILESGRVATIAANAEPEIAFTRDIPALVAGEYHYVRVVQVDGGAAWSSPFFVDGPPEAAGAEAP